MPKVSFQKRRIIFLKELLLERTDENHFLTMDEIIVILQANDLQADKRTIREDISVLRDDMGIDIVEKTRPRLSYKVVKRDFDLQEISLLRQRRTKRKEQECGKIEE